MYQKPEIIYVLAGSERQMQIHTSQFRSRHIEFRFIHDERQLRGLPPQVIYICGLWWENPLCPIEDFLKSRGMELVELPEYPFKPWALVEFRNNVRIAKARIATRKFMQDRHYKAVRKLWLAG